mgnify:CR=1 FL=1
MSIDGANPRFLMMQRPACSHTPAGYGGDPKQAEAVFRQALTAFDKEPTGKPWPNWGRFDAHVWLGQALAGRGDAEGRARNTKRRSALAPDSSRVGGPLAAAEIALVAGSRAGS